MTDCVITQNLKQLRGIKRIYNGHSVLIRNILSFKKIGSFKKKGYILWVGSNLPRKQPEFFIQIAKELPSYNFKMIVSKSKQCPSTDNLKKSCAGLSNVEFVGGVPFHEIQPYFQKASLLVSTSISEGFPNVFLQAWQCSTPVVSLNINPDNIITKFRLGFIAADISNLRSNIIRIMEDDILREQMGKNSLDYVQQYHNTDNIINKYCNLFNRK